MIPATNTYVYMHIKFVNKIHFMKEEQYSLPSTAMLQKASSAVNMDSEISPYIPIDTSHKTTNCNVINTAEAGRPS